MILDEVENQAALIAFGPVPDPGVRVQSCMNDRFPHFSIKEMRGNEAVVRTTEYWYLRWWSTVEQKYRYPYRETSRHTYILVKTSDGWRVEENIHPAPRSSTPHRQRK